MSTVTPNLALVARAIADPTRAEMCLALMDGRAWTAGELARHVGVARSTSTEHLHILVDAGVFSERYQGRHRYVRLADDGIAEVIESLTARTPGVTDPRQKPHSATADTALRRARTCYDHLAGSLGVALTDALVALQYLSCEDEWSFTSVGRDWAESIGADLASPRRSGRPLARPCLDWTERRDHLAGSSGAMLCHRFLQLDWIERTGAGRTIRLTRSGETAFRSSLNIAWFGDKYTYVGDERRHALAGGAI